MSNRPSNPILRKAVDLEYWRFVNTFRHAEIFENTFSKLCLSHWLQIHQNIGINQSNLKFSKKTLVVILSHSKFESPYSPYISKISLISQRKAFPVFTTLLPFYVTDLSLNPQKTKEKLWFSDVFIGYRKRPVV